MKKRILSILLSVSLAAGSMVSFNTGKVEAAETNSGSVASEGGDTVVLAATKAGWVKSGGKWYFYSKGKKVTCWKKISGKWYFFGSNGVMQTKWRQISGKWYYFGSSGAMQTGWKKIGGKWYFFGSDGFMRSGWKKIGGKWYYFADGAMQTGWKKIDGKWYYFKSSGIYDSSKDGKITSSFPAKINLRELAPSLWYGQSNYYGFHQSGNYPSGEDTMIINTDNSFYGAYVGKNGLGCRYTGKFTSVKIVDGYYKSNYNYKILISAKLTSFNKAYSNGSYYYDSSAGKTVKASDHPVLQKGKTYYFYVEAQSVSGDSYGGGHYAELLDSNKRYTSYMLAVGSY